MNLQEQDQTQVEEKQSQGVEIEAKVFEINLGEVAKEAMKEAQEEAYKREKAHREENPHYVELVFGPFRNSVPVFFRDREDLTDFVSDWDRVSQDEQRTITAYDVKLKSDLGGDQTFNLHFNVNEFSGIKYPVS